jgi:hypothetical protein
VFVGAPAVHAFLLRRQQQLLWRAASELLESELAALQSARLPVALQTAGGAGAGAARGTAVAGGGAAAAGPAGARMPQWGALCRAALARAAAAPPPAAARGADAALVLDALSPGGGLLLEEPDPAVSDEEDVSVLSLRPLILQHVVHTRLRHLLGSFPPGAAAAHAGAPAARRARAAAGGGGSGGAAPLAAALGRWLLHGSRRQLLRGELDRMVRARVGLVPDCAFGKPARVVACWQGPAWLGNPCLVSLLRPSHVSPAIPPAPQPQLALRPGVVPQTLATCAPCTSAVKLLPPPHAPPAPPPPAANGAARGSEDGSAHRPPPPPALLLLSGDCLSVEGGVLAGAGGGARAGPGVGAVGGTMGAPFSQPPQHPPPPPRPALRLTPARTVRPAGPPQTRRPCSAPAAGRRRRRCPTRPRRSPRRSPRSLAAPTAFAQAPGMAGTRATASRLTAAAAAARAGRWRRWTAGDACGGGCRRFHDWRAAAARLGA